MSSRSVSTSPASRSSRALAPASISSRREASQTIPQGDNAPLNQVLLQAPGVAQDSFGQIHVRGEHANVQYRINGVELPEGLSVFGQALKSRFASSMSLITGALPAQYGFQTAGVVDIQTKTGTTNPGLGLSMYGGSWGWLQPSFEYGGRAGPVDWYVTGDFLHNNRGIENPTSSFNAIHDTTNQFHGLAYVSGIIDPDTRISLILGGFNGGFQIPNNPGQPTLGFTVNGVSRLQQRELERDTSTRRPSSASCRCRSTSTTSTCRSPRSPAAARCRFSPDWLGDLLFNGIAQQASRTDWASGVQADGSWRINEQHTLRAGFLAQGEGGSQIRSRRCCRWMRRGRRRQTCRSRSPTTVTRPGVSTASISRTNGACCRR